MNIGLLHRIALHDATPSHPTHLHRFTLFNNDGDSQHIARQLDRPATGLWIGLYVVLDKVDTSPLKVFSRLCTVLTTGRCIELYHCAHQFSPCVSNTFRDVHSCPVCAHVQVAHRSMQIPVSLYCFMIYSESLPPHGAVPSTRKKGHTVEFPMILLKIATPLGRTKGKNSARSRGGDSWSDVARDSSPRGGGPA